MATAQNPPSGGPTQPTPDLTEVRRLEEASLKLGNMLRLKREISKADKAQKDLYSEIVKLQGQEAQNALKYKRATMSIANLEKNLQTQRAQGNKQGAIATQRLIDAQKKQQEQLAKTAGGALRAQEIAAAKQKANLKAEKDLIEGINKQRGLGTKIMNLFRSKEERQRQIDIARAKAGGGANVSRSKGSEEEAAAAAAASTNPYAAAALAVVNIVKKGLSALAGPLLAAGKLALKSITAPFADAAALLTGQDYGMGSGKVKTGGPGNLLGGLQEFANAIPFVGGLLGGLAGILKTMVEGLLGIEQGIFRFARDLNISYGRANQMKNSFLAIEKSSGNLAINAARLMQSQVDITKQLGVNKQLGIDILKNDVLLRDVVGTEAEIRQSIATTSIITGRNAAKLTQSIMGTVIGFDKILKTGFNFNGIMREAAKLTGIVGLTFAKYPEKIVKALIATKALGFELQQLEGMADGFLNFEESISKEMEAQVLTGREINLNLAREAALNNDYATLAKEITKNVGDSNAFLKLNRIQQEAIAGSVNMTAAGLADVLKKQELYSKLGATDLKTFHERVALLEKQGKTQEQISALLGKDAYNSYTQLSTAERITEVLEKMKRAFVELIRQSGIFDFITNPEKITNFVRGLADILAGAIDLAGRAISSLLNGLSVIVGFFSEKYGREMQSVAGGIRIGTGVVSQSIRTATGVLGGTPAPSVGATVQRGAQQQAQAASPAPATRAAAAQSNRPLQFTSFVQIDKQTVGKSVFEVGPEQYNAVLV